MLEDCSFEDCTGYIGGAVKCSGNNARFERCVFQNNIALEQGGAVACFVDEVCDFVNCIFNTNFAPQGGAIHADEADLVANVINCTFNWNTAWPGSAALHFGETVGSISNSIVRTSVPEPAVGTDVTIAYSNVEGGFPGPGNIDADPHFVDSAAGDFRLTFASPCIDAGWNDALPEGIETDFAGNERFVDIPFVADTGLGDSPVVDMGAYEAQESSVDLNGDGVVGPADLALLLGAWGLCDDAARGSAECSADLNGDDEVGPADLAILLGQWGSSGR